jgi:hypothetical protein
LLRKRSASGTASSAEAVPQVLVDGERVSSGGSASLLIARVTRACDTAV